MAAATEQAHGGADDSVPAGHALDPGQLHASAGVLVAQDVVPTATLAASCTAAR